MRLKIGSNRHLKINGFPIYAIPPTHHQINTPIRTINSPSGYRRIWPNFIISSTKRRQTYLIQVFDKSPYAAYFIGGNSFSFKFY